MPFRRRSRLLAARDPRAALEALDRYGVRYPSGLFATEGQVLRVEALFALGERETAKRLADQLLVQYPESPYARRLRTLANAGGNTIP